MKCLFFLKRLICLFFVIMLFFIISCDNGSNGNNNSPSEIGALESIKTKGIKTLFTADISLQENVVKTSAQGNIKRASRSTLSESKIKTLMYIDKDGRDLPIVITTSTGRDVILQIFNVIKVGERRLVADYSAIWEVEETEVVDGIKYEYIRQEYAEGRLLLNMESGVIYDFSQYPMNRFLVDGTTLYAISSEVS